MKRKQIFLGIIILLVLVFSSCSCKKKTYYFDGKLQSCYEVRNPFSSTKHGNYKFYELNGVLVYEANYKDGKEDGVSSSYFKKDGRLKWRAVFKEDKLINILEYFDNKGNKLDCGKLVNGNGYIKLFLDDGQIEEAGPVLDGFRNGLWKYYANDTNFYITNSYINGVDKDGLKPPTLN